MMTISQEASKHGFRRLFSPLQIGDFETANRIVCTTHGSRLPLQRDLAYLRARARGGAGMLGLHGSAGVASYSIGVAPEAQAPDWDEEFPSPATDAGVTYFDETAIAAMRARADAVHAEGATCYGQVYHLGVAGHTQGINPPLGPSAVPDPYDALAPYALRDVDVDELIHVFAHGVRRIREAGMDAAELHAAHGYLIFQFLSPYFNRRGDRWGGTRTGRLGFLQAIIAQARLLVGEFPIGVRIGTGLGIDDDELCEIATEIAPQVAFISVSGGSYSGFSNGYELPYVSSWNKEPAYNRNSAARIRARVKVPVIVTGRILDASVAEGLLADGTADLVGMVRALIADPDLPVKAASGRADQVRMCLGLGECHYIGPHRKPVTCAVNAAASREAEMTFMPASRPRTILVVGAGPAGMEAARVAASRGHTVYLADLERHIGGTPRLLAADRNRRNLLDHAVFFENQLKKLGVEFALGNRITVEDVAALSPDAVVIATGGRAVIPDVPGIQGAHVLTALDLLRQRDLGFGASVVVGGLDGHIAGATVAEYLADLGKPVELISEHPDFAPGADDAIRNELRARLAAKGVRYMPHTRLESASNGSALLRDLFSGAQRSLDDVTVILACGLVANDGLARALTNEAVELRIVGDALAPRRIMHATLEGARVGGAL
jgi:2,4-dienoyl-CoA reductase-like NADH-dependent reductase (Old Yellow Enzyme family)/thioredoxin reductase